MRRILLLCALLGAGCRPASEPPQAAPDTARVTGAAVGGEAALARMQGQWQAVDDTAARVEVRGTEFISRYTGQEPHGGTLAFVATCGGRPADASRRYFVLTEEGTPYCYFLQVLNDSVMHLTYVAEGQTLGYRRVGPAYAVAPTAPAPEEASAYAVSLDPDGLRLVSTVTGATRPIAFGTPRARTLTALTAVLGVPRETGTNPECGAGPLAFATWKEGLSALFSDEVFAGWTVTGRAPDARRFTTMVGLGVGTTRAELSEDYEVRVGETSLGTEFTIGSIGGLLSGTAPEATVTHLWAGTTCMAR